MKRTSKQIYNNIEYHVQNKNDVEHQQMKLFYGIAQFPELLFYGPYIKPHGVHGLGKHYHV